MILNRAPSSAVDLARLLASGRTPVRAVLTWNEVDYKLERELAQRVAAQGSLWREIESGTPKARLFVRW